MKRKINLDTHKTMRIKAKAYFILAIVFFIEFLVALIALKSFLLSLLGITGSIIMLVLAKGAVRFLTEKEYMLIKNEELLAEYEKLLKEESNKENTDS